MTTETHTINLTWPFLVWSICWCVVSYATGSWAVLWIAAAPWLLFFGLFASVLLLMGIAYLSGKRISLTNKNTSQVKYYQRGRK